MNRDAMHAKISRLPAQVRQSTPLWVDAQGSVVARFFGCHLTSVFQPIRNPNNSGIVGYEAFVRSYDESGQGLSPWNLFAQFIDDDALIALDRLCRTVHALNYFCVSPRGVDLFLNVHGRLLLAVREDHGRAFRRVLESLDVAASRVIIELPQSLADDLPLAAYITSNYRMNGFRVALNLTRTSRPLAVLRHIRVDFIKMDVRNFSSAVDMGTVGAAARAVGTRLIVKRVETASHLAMVRAARVQLSQGYAFDAVQSRTDGSNADHIGVEANVADGIGTRVAVAAGTRRCGRI